MKNTIIGIIIGALIIGGVYLFMQNQQLKQDTQSSDASINISLPTDTNGR